MVKTLIGFTSLIGYPRLSQRSSLALTGAQRPSTIATLARRSVMREEWQRVQATFVDDPQRAVQEASVLIDRTLDEIRANVGSGRTSEAVSTEELRVSFQRYREFFQRLLSA
jgi:hypothetical protein